jgi:hypothetical protein
MILSREYKENWNSFEKMSFRFLCIYFSLYILGSFLSVVFQPLVKWVGESVFNITYIYKISGSGSGDNTYQYLLTFTYFILAIITCIIWSVLDRKRKSYNSVWYGLLVLIRITLIFFMLLYGLIKVFHMQMTPPSYSRLIEPLGEMSPMGLAWTFMGYSKGYSIFAGSIEVLAGLLLISRRTVTIGALVTIGVMTQVFIMNMCFDIPVKIFSFHLLLMGFVLFLADSKRFLRAILLGKAVTKDNSFPVYNKESFKIITIAKISLLVIAVGFVAITSLSRGKDRLNKLNPPLSGVWEVISFNKKGKEISPNLTYKDSWQYLVVDVKDRMTLHRLNKTKQGYYTSLDTVAKKISFKKTKADEDQWIKYSLENKTLILEGILERDTLNIVLNRKTKEDFLLTNRGFHWINERPLNR